ncbi:multidrug resistance protein 1 [Coprinopsis cinerea AmutBmut pab1-1]|nr:multidrug resistance protein 1 [Coprinopsis cinerea AmutBmut pab1-1]
MFVCRSAPSVFVRSTSKPFSVKISRTSTTLDLDKLLPVFRPTLVALTVSFVAAFVTDFILAYAQSWRIAPAMSSILPCMTIAGDVMNKFISAQVIGTVRTAAQAFGTQRILSGQYDNHVNKALTVDLKSASWHGSGLAFFLINQGQATAGSFVNVFLAILIGSISLTLLAPEIQALTHGCGAAAKLYETIDRVPDIDSYDEGGLKPETVIDEITIENVFFAYPSRPTVQVIKNLSHSARARPLPSLVPLALANQLPSPSLNASTTPTRMSPFANWIGVARAHPIRHHHPRQRAHGLIGTKWEKTSEEEQFKLIKDACVKANAGGFKSPNGHDTMIGERGFLLSGGQKQRHVAIVSFCWTRPLARSILNPRVLLFRMHWIKLQLA